MIRLPWRYSGWLLRDMARGPLALLGLMLAAGLLMPAVTISGGTALIGNIFPHVLRVCVFIAVLALTWRIVNRDLERGYYRVFFSRPVDAGGYYLLRWLLGALLLNIFAALLTGIVALKYGAKLPFFQYAAQISLYYLVLGGLVFFLSSVFSADVGVALPLCMLSAYAHSATSCPGWLSAVAWLLPPLHLVRFTARAPEDGSPLYAVIYGLVMVAAAVVILQRRRFAEGGKGD